MSAPKKGRALYDYKGNPEQRQLSFSKGDMVNVTNQFDNGWWAGELNGTLGYFPATYVQILEDGGSPAPGPAKPQPAKPQPAKVASPSPVKPQPVVPPKQNPTPSPAKPQPAKPQPVDQHVGPVAPQPIAQIKRTSMAVAQQVGVIPPQSTKPQPVTPVPKPQPAPPQAKVPVPKPRPANEASQQDINELDALIAQLEDDARELGKMLQGK